MIPPNTTKSRAGHTRVPHSARASSRPTIEPLESRIAPAALFPEFVDPNPSAGNGFGAFIVPLSTGKVVVASPLADVGGTDTGAVYLYDGATGALISTLVGSTAGDQVGATGITALSNGNFVVRSAFWDNGGVVDAGAVTWGNGTTGVNGVVSATNSLVGSTASDNVGITGVTALTNGNYVVRTEEWDGAVANVGAVTWGNGATGIIGPVSAANSLVGSTLNDNVGGAGVIALTNGNYVVSSNNWSNGGVGSAGAVTWGNGNTGVSGAVSAANSLVGTALSDTVGVTGITALPNGNYVVRSSAWNNGGTIDAGAVTWGDGTTGITGAVNAANSLVGSRPNDLVGSGGVVVLTNGHYVIRSLNWDNAAVGNAGAVTWANGATGIAGAVSSANSLVGTTSGDLVGSGALVALTNGNYVVGSNNWHNGGVATAGAATWGNGATGISGAVSQANSLVGSSAGDVVGSTITPLSNGNYVVRSPSWDGALPNVGAVTWGDGTVGTIGAVAAANSLVGTTAEDQVGSSIVLALTNGNYVVGSSLWDNGPVADVGAVTWGNGATGLFDTVSPANSLVGSTQSDQLALSGGITALTNGNYVVRSLNWDNGPVVDAGAVTWGNGAAGVTGAVSPANSLVGSTMSDQVGTGGVAALNNGNYVVRSTNWDNGAVVNAGAATWGSGTTGVTGPVSAANSLVGSTANDNVSSTGVIAGLALPNGNYVVTSANWDNGGLANSGAVTWGSGAVGVSGAVGAGNSTLGLVANAAPVAQIVDATNNNFISRFSAEGKIRVRSMDDGLAAAGGSLAPTLIGGTLTILDTAGVLNNLTVSVNAGNLVITDANEQFASAPAGATLSNGFRTLTIPLASITTGFTFDGAGDDDLFTLDFSTGNVIPNGGLLFQAGAQGPNGDSLILLGGTTSTVTHTFTNAADGSVALAGALAGTVSFIGLEAIDSNVATVNSTLNYDASVAKMITITDAGGGRTMFTSTAGGTVTTPSPAGSLTLNGGSNADTFDVFSLANFPGSLTIDGKAGADTVNLSFGLPTLGGLTVVTETLGAVPALTLGAGGLHLTTATSGILLNGAISSAGDSTLDSAAGIDFFASITMAVNQSLTVNALGSITFNSPNADFSSTGTGAISLTTARNLEFTSGASVMTANGNITLNANQQAIQTAGGFDGFRADNALIQATGSGNITINARGGIIAAANFVNGLALDPQSTIRTNTGSITIVGVGGQSLGDENNGLRLMFDSVVESTGGGSIDLTGTGGGRTAGAGQGMIGIRVGGVVRTTGAGTLTLTGTGGAVGSAADNFGVQLRDESGVTSSGSGTITINATGGANNAPAFFTTVGAKPVGFDGVNPYSGAIVINANSMDLTGAVIQTTGTATLRPQTNGTLINLGAADSAGVLGLTDAELDQVTAGTVQIGNANSGAITVSAAITHGNHLSLTTGAGVTFSQSVTMAVNKNLTVSALGTATGTINLANANADLTASGTGAISLTTARNIVLASGASVTTVDGALTVSANQQVTATAGSFFGVDVSAGLIQATGSGVVTVAGKGGNSGDFQIGVILGGDIIGGTGAVAVTGVGGNSAGNFNYGTWVINPGSTIASGGGNITVSGTGGGSGASSANQGVIVQEGSIAAGGSGTVSVTGVGGTTNGNNNIGIRVGAAGSTISSGGGNVTVNGTGGGGSNAGQNVGVSVLDGALITAGGVGAVAVTGLGGSATGFANYGVQVATTGAITSGGGSVTVNGTGGGSGTNNLQNGVVVNANGLITAGGTGAVMVTGQGGNGSGGSNQGIRVLDAGSRITSGGGNVVVTGTQGTASGSFGVQVETAGAITTVTNGGSITLVANSMDFTTGSPVITAGAGNVTLRQNTNGTQINLGAADSAGVLGLTDAELDRITAGILQIGDSNSGAITVSAALTHANNLTLTTGAGVTFNQAVTMAVNKSFTVSALGTTNGTINLANANADLSATGTGAISLTTARNITAASGSSIAVVNGALTLSANASGATTGAFIGIDLSGATLTTSGTGSISLTGKGGAGSTAHSLVGVSLQLDAVMQSTLSGATAGGISVTGTGGGTGISATDYGVEIGGGQSSGVNNTRITSVSGAIVVTGTGGTGNGGGQVGIDIRDGGQIISTGTGATAASITLIGTGSAGAGPTNPGLSMGSTNGNFVFGTAVTSVDGAISITGTGAANGSYGAGILLGQGARVAASGTGSVSLTGTGPTGTGPGLEGVFIDGEHANGQDTQVTAANGNLTITGTATDPAFSGIFIGSPAFVSTSGAGSITLIADRMSLAGAVNAGAQTATLRQQTNGTPINLGGADSASTLGLSDAELDFVTAGTVQIGDANSGAITVSAAITHANHLSLTTGAGVSGAGALTLAAGKNLGVTANGAINLSGAITVPGTTTLAAGAANNITLTNAGNALATVSITSGATVSLRDDGGFDLGATNASTLLSVESAGAITQSAPISGTGGLTKLGLGTLTLSLANTYTGTTTISDGTLQVGNGGTTGTLGTGAVTNNSALVFNRSDSLTLATAIAGTGTLNVTADGITTSVALNLGGDATFNSTAGITFANSVTMAANKSLTVSALGTTNGTINLSTTNSDLSTSGTGAISLTTVRNILMTTVGASVRTVNGDITMNANQQAVQTSGDFFGVRVDDGLIEATGTGSIAINGRGGIDPVGVFTCGLSFINTPVRTNTGSITMAGVGGQTLGNQNNGLQVHAGGIVESTGGGSIDLTGIGGGGNNAPGTGQVMQGIRVLLGGIVRTTGTGDITLTGTGGAVGSASDNYGVRIDNAGAVTSSGSGTITINATGGANNAPAFRTDTGTNRVGFDGVNPYSGNIMINADSMDITGADIQTTGTATLRQQTNSTLIDLGGADSAGTLGLTDAELDIITAGTLQIGNANSGAITVSAAMTYANHLGLTTGAGVAGASGITLAAGKNLSVTANGAINLTGPLVVPGTSTFTAGANAITLTNAGNNFTEAVALSNSGTGAVSIVDANALTLGASTVGTGTLSATAGGALTVSGAIGFGGGLNLTVNGADQPLFVQGTLTKASGGNATATLKATGDVRFESSADLTVSAGALALILNSDSDANNAGGVLIDTGSALVTNGGNVTIGGGASPATTPTGGFDVAFASRGVLIVNGGAIDAGAGNVSIRGHGRDGGAGFATAIEVQGSVTTSSGSITFVGTGGNNALNLGNGVQVQGVVESTGGGSISLTGTAAGTGEANLGIRIFGNGAVRTTGAGNITITGTGSATGANTNNYGVSFASGSTVSIAGSGGITVNATAGASSPAFFMASDGNLVGFDGVTPYSGNIAINANTVSLADHSIVTTSTVTFLPLSANVTISLGGAATLDLTDLELDGVTAGMVQIGSATSGAITIGAAITHTNDLSLTTGAGVTFNQPVTMAVNKNLTATAGVAGTVTVGNTLTASGTGAIQLTGQNVTGAGNIATGGGLTVSNTGTASTLAGGISGTGDLSKTGAGTLTLSAGNSYSGSTVVSGGTMLVDGTLSNTASVAVVTGATLGGIGTIAAPVTPNNGRLAPGGSPGVLGTGSLSFNPVSNFDVEINGAALANHDQLNVTGTVSLTGATLNPSGTITSVPGQQVTLIANDGADPVSGTFTGLAEGATVTVNGVSFTITYAGGSDSNDVLLMQAAPPVIDTELTLVAGDLVITDIAAGGHSGTLTLQPQPGNGLFVISDPTRNLAATGIPGANVSPDLHTVTVPFAAVTGTQILVNSLAGDDDFTVDLTLGPLAKTLSLDGGVNSGEGDKLFVTGLPVTSAAFAFIDAQAGGITLAGSSGITYTGLEALDTSIPTTNLTLNYNASAPNTITVTDASAGKTTVASTAGATLKLVNPSAALIVNGGSGGDTFNLNSLSNFPGALTIAGLDGNDSVNLAAGLPTLAGLTVTTEGISALPALTIGTGGLSVTTTTSAIDVNGGITSGGTVNLQSGGAITNTLGTIAAVNVTLTAVDGITMTLDGARLSATVTGGGGIALQAVNNAVTLTSITPGAGGVNLASGAFELSKDEAITSGAFLTVGGTLNLNGSSQTVSGPTGAGTITNFASMLSMLSIGGASDGSTFSGNLQGNLAIVKVGAGTQILSGATNNYAGGTTITSGTLQFNASGAALNGEFTLGGGTLFYNFSSSSLLPKINLTEPSSIGVATGESITLGEVISGRGGLTKTGGGTLVLENELNTFGPASVTIAGGTLQVATDGALGEPTNQIVFNNGTLKTTDSFASARKIVQNGTAILDVATGTALTLVGPIDDPIALVDNRIGLGALQFAFVFVDDLPVLPGNPVIISGTSVAATGSATVKVHTVGGLGIQIDTIELTNTTPTTNLTINGTGTINRIVSDGDLGSLVLGTGVLLGDGVRDSVPELEISGKAAKLQLYDLAPYAYIDLGKELPYEVLRPNSTKIDTTKSQTKTNRPNLTIHKVTGPGVLIDVTGDGMVGGIGGGGLGKVIVDEWHSTGIPGAIRTTQSITSFKLTRGNSTVVFEVDKFHLGSSTTAAIGSMTIQNGSWGSSGSEIEGNVGSFNANEFLAGATLTAGSMGKFTLDAGAFAGLLTLTDPDAAGIPTFTVVGNFSGSVLSASPLKKINVKGDFTGELEAPFIGAITAYAFLGTNEPGEYNAITATEGSLGTLTATAGVVRNFSIVTDQIFKGFNIKLSKLMDDTIGIDNVHIQALSIGNISVSLAASATAPAGIDLVGILNSDFITTGTGATKATLGSIGNITVTLTGVVGGNSATGIVNSTFDALVEANEFASNPNASTVNTLGRIAVKITGQDGPSLGLDNVEFLGNSIGVTAVSVSRGTAVTAAASAIDLADYTATGAIGAMIIDGDATSTQVTGLNVWAGANVGAITVKAKTLAHGTIEDSAILAGQALDVSSANSPILLARLAKATLGAVNVSGSLIYTDLIAGASIGAVTVGGSMTDSLILAGALLGDDLALGGSGGDIDTFQRAAAIAAVTVKGASGGTFARTSIIAGVSPGNGTFGDSGDAVGIILGALPNISSIGAISLPAGVLASVTGSQQFGIEAGKITSLKLGLTAAVPITSTKLLDLAGGDDVLVKLIA